MSLSLVDSFHRAFPTPKLQKSDLTRFFQNTQESTALEMIEELEKAGPEYSEFTEAELWQIKVLRNLDFKDSEFLSLSPQIQSLIYRTANNFHKVSLITRLNSIGTYTVAHQIQGPSLFHRFSDVATIYRTISEFFITLRHVNRFLTKSEFESQKSEYFWIKKGDFNRLLGRDHLQNVITKLNLKWIKVPEKKAILESTNATLAFNVRMYESDLMVMRCQDLDVYAQKIEPVQRFVSREEIEELLILIQESRYSDLWPSNFIVAKDGIYLIDTEPKSFSTDSTWNSLKQFSKHLAEKDHAWFLERLSQKDEEQEKLAEKNCWSFDTAEIHLKSEKKEGKKQVQQGTLDTEFITTLIEAKQFVKGCKLVGSHKTRTFSFPVQDLLYRKS